MSWRCRSDRDRCREPRHLRNPRGLVLSRMDRVHGVVRLGFTPPRSRWLLWHPCLHWELQQRQRLHRPVRRRNVESFGRW